MLADTPNFDSCESWNKINHSTLEIDNIVTLNKGYDKDLCERKTS